MIEAGDTRTGLLVTGHIVIAKGPVTVQENTDQKAKRTALWTAEIENALGVADLHKTAGRQPRFTVKKMSDQTVNECSSKDPLQLLQQIFDGISARLVETA